MLSKIINSVKREEGQLLIIIALAVFAFSSVIMIPLLQLTNTNVVAARGQGLSVQEIYASEAGVHDAMWKIMFVVTDLPKEVSDPPLVYSVDGGVNGRTVEVTITMDEVGVYHINSVASNDDTGHERTIDSEIGIGVSGIDLSEFTNNALSSPGEINLKSTDVINGDIWTENLNDNGATITGDIDSSPVSGWPTTAELLAYFQQMVDMSEPYDDDSEIPISDPAYSGPLYASGLSSYTIEDTGTLTGTIYVNGDLTITNSAEVNLNGKTIFVTGDIVVNGGDVVGPGSIIAIGDVDFQPNLSPTYLFVMSVEGTVNLQPGSDFYGAIAGNTEINLQPNCTLNWIDPGVGNLQMPGMFNNINAVSTWKIS